MHVVPSLRSAFALSVTVLFSLSASAATTSTPLQINAVGTGSLASAPPAQTSGANEPNEIDPASIGDDADAAGPGSAAPVHGGAAAVPLNRSIHRSEGRGETDDGRTETEDGPRAALSFDGLTLRDQRLANGGNQFTVEPPDQGLCVGNGFVLESVNDVLRIWDTRGTALTGPIDLNTFYGYPAAINRTSNKFGPSITDPSCVYDAATRRWFHVVLTLDRKSPNGSALSGKNHLDIAVSSSADPRSAWTIYKLPVQNDGTDGTPNHGCTNGPCLGDYPHLAVNRDGLFLTTNEFALFGPGFFGAQVYALSKSALVKHAATVPGVLINTGDPSIPFNGFTLWPAQAPDGGEEDDGDGNGVEYFMSSLAVFDDNGTSNQILVWSLSNTRSLRGSRPNLTLDAQFVNTLTYGVPPRSDQLAGDFPFGQCLSDTTIATPFGAGCWRNFFVSGGPFPNVEKKIDSNDSRMQQVYFSRGKLWGALDTAVTVSGENRAGIAWFIVNPRRATVENQGVVAVAGNNVTRPAVAATSDGRGIVAFTLTGKNHFPSAAFTTIDSRVGAGDIHVVAEGVGADDGFTGYNPRGNFGSRPRWGDYGAAATDGSDVWIASEYIGQSCTLSTYVSTGFSCGGTRVSQGNWYTRISKVKTDD